MKYDFETLVNRAAKGSLKWSSMKKTDGTKPPEGIVPFSVADMELKNAPEIVEAIKKAADESNPFGYTGPTDAYYDAVCGWMQRRHNWKIKKEWIELNSGVVPALSTAVITMTQPGEGVIVMSPVYYPFYKAVENNGRTLVENPLICTDNHYEIDFDDLAKKAADPNTTMLILCSPHNPVGRVWTREELTRLGRICIDNNVLVLSDEIHFDFIMPGYKHTVFAAISEEFANHSIISTAPSKTFNLAGLQTSNIIIPNEELRKKYAGNRYSFLNTFGYVACQAAYDEAEGWLEELLVHLDKNRKLFVSFMAENFPKMKIYEMQGTYLQWFDCRSLGLDAEGLEKFMHDEALFYMDEGTMFGSAGSGFERLNLACPTKVLEAALIRLKVAVDRCGLIR